MDPLQFASAMFLSASIGGMIVDFIWRRKMNKIVEEVRSGYWRREI